MELNKIEVRWRNARIIAIAPTNSIQQEPETVPPVVVTSRIDGVMPQRGGRCAIATSGISQEQAASISEPQPPKDIASPVLPSAKPQPVVPKKLSDEEIQRLEDELKRLSINPESCMEIVRKYWDNVQGAIASAGRLKFLPKKRAGMVA